MSDCYRKVNRGLDNNLEMESVLTLTRLKTKECVRVTRLDLTIGSVLSLTLSRPMTMNHRVGP